MIRNVPLAPYTPSFRTNWSRVDVGMYSSYVVFTDGALFSKERQLDGDEASKRMEKPRMLFKGKLVKNGGEKS